MNKNDTVAIIRSLLSSTNSSYNIYNLNRDFKNETGVDIPLFGYSNISDFLQSIPDTVKVTGIYPIQKVSLVTNEKSAHIVSLVKRQRNSEQKKTAFTKSKPLSREFAVGTRTNGFQKSQVPRGTTLEESKEPNDGFDKATPLFEANLLPGNENVTLPSNPTNGLVSLENCLGIGESIPQIDMEHHAQVGGYVEVYPCQIFNPHRFYFHLRKFRKKLSEFMYALRTFYVTYHIPKVADELIRPKLICAVFCKIYGEPMWYRAEIQEVVSNSHVILNFIDYGALVKMSKENVKYLHRNFMSLPRQACLGSLANIRPSKGSLDWSPNAVKRFFNLSFRKDLVAGVVHMDPKDYCMKVALSCTKGLEIHINDTLVKEGYAEFDTNVLECHSSDIMERSCSWKISKGVCNKNEFSSDRTNYNKELTEDILKPMGDCICPNLRSPIFYSSNNHDNNQRLKKMFSAQKN